jgi:hypothetical protein
LKDDGNRVGRSFGCERWTYPAARNDDRDLTAHQVGRQSRQSIELVLRPTIFDQDVAAINVAGFAQALPKCRHEIGAGLGRTIMQKPDDRHRRLLRARRERASSRTADVRDEFPSPHEPSLSPEDETLPHQRKLLCVTANWTAPLPDWVMNRLCLNLPYVRYHQQRTCRPTRL